MSEITVVSGVNHHMEAFSAVSNGMTVKFVHDEANRFSENAVWAVVDGIGVIGHITENYIPAGFKAYGEDAVRSPDILNRVIRENKEYEAIIDGKRPNGCLIIFKVKEEEVLEEMEEDTMDKWEIGTNKEEFTLVGCGRWDSGVKIGDAVVVDVENYYIRANGKIGGTAAAFTADGHKIGVFPQSDRKKADVEEMRGKMVSGDEIKEARASDTLINEGYFVVDISKDGRYVKVAFGGFELLPEEDEEPEPVVEEINEEKEVETMYEIIAIATNKMNELLTLYKVETIVEPVVEEKEPVMVPEYRTPLPNVVNEDEYCIRLAERRNKLINESIEIQLHLDAIEKEIDEVTHQLAERVEAMTLISEIKDNIGALEMDELRQIHNIVMKDAVSSSDKEEEPSSVLRKVHEGKWLNEEEWEEYVEDYWERGFNILREQEKELDLNNDKIVKRFVKRVKRFNKQLNQFKSQGYNKILTLYWIEDYNVLRTVCDQFNLSATRLTGSCILKDNDISFFLEA